MKRRPDTFPHLVKRSFKRAVLAVILGITVVALTSQCGAPEGKRFDGQPLFEKVPAASSGITFVNRTKPSFDFNILEYNYFYNGGGVAAADFNDDGLMDLFFAGNMVSSALYLNKGDLQFEDVTESAGLRTESWIAGVTVADVNADGMMDLYLCAAGYPEPETRNNLLFVNQGRSDDGILQFKEQAAAYGLNDLGYSSQAAFFDYDLDGDLDVYIATVHHDKTNPNIPRPKVDDGTHPSTDKLYENRSEDCENEDCQIRFRDVSKEAGILKEGYGLGLVVDDFNRDGWPDVFVSNDFIYNDLLYINNQDGTFTDQATEAFRHQSQFSMGTDVADINHDGWPDLIVLDMLPDDNLRQKQMNVAMNYDRFSMALDNGYLPQYSRNALHLNQGAMNGGIHFSEIGLLAGVHQTDWSWSPLWADLDLDGAMDLFVSNGIPKDITDSDYIVYRDQQVIKGDFDYDVLKKELLGQLEELPPVDKSNFAFRKSGKLSFEDMTVQWGLSEPSFSHGAVAVDLDNDGDLDLVTNNLEKEAFLYRNTAADDCPDCCFLKVQLEGPPKNPNGFGSKLEVHTAERTYYRYHHPVHGFQSANAGPAYFGLGKDSLISKVVVHWPGGKTETLTHAGTRTQIKLSYSDAVDAGTRPGRKTGPLMQEQPDFLNHRHTENHFVDFKFEPLLPHQYSRQGPAMAVADVNQDGLEDLFIGGPVKQGGMLYLQQSEGGFRIVTFPDENYEDTGALFFDADGDGDQDLYVVSGGNEYNANTAPYQDRLYLNEGQGHFTKRDDALPPLYFSGNAIVAFDYDQDGDQDLFVGGRVVPGNYPLPAPSALLQNHGGYFKEVGSQVFPGFRQLGLVTDALATDFNGDEWPDLLIAGEYMPLTFLQNDGGTFTDVTAVTGLADHKGWWRSLAQADFDEDGDIDFVAGNLGTNSKFKATPETPVTVTAGDFNEDGSLDALLGYPAKDSRGDLQIFPFHSRDALADKIRPIRRQFPSYMSFSQASMQQVLDGFTVDRTYRASASYMESAFVENVGHGQYAMRPLPIEAQFAPINCLQVVDLDQDGHLDIIAAGNSYDSEFTNGWYDASNGWVLLGDGSGSFEFTRPQSSGFFVPGDSRDLTLIRTADDIRVLLVGRNNQSTVAYGLPALR